MNKPNIPKPPPPRHVHCHKEISLRKENTYKEFLFLTGMSIGFTIGFSLGILL